MITYFRHTTVGRTPLDEGPACRRDLYLTTHNTYKRQTSMPRWDIFFFTCPGFFLFDPFLYCLNPFRPSCHFTVHITVLTTNTNIHAPGGIRTHDPSKRAAEDPRLRPHGHWDRQKNIYIYIYIYIYIQFIWNRDLETSKFALLCGYSIFQGYSNHVMYTHRTVQIVRFRDLDSI
jgi:hypothetical protein